LLQAIPELSAPSECALHLIPAIEGAPTPFQKPTMIQL
jgi:hypothetical protein